MRLFHIAVLEYLNFTPAGFAIKQIKNKGLEHTHVTALTYFNNKICVSTASGLYYLDWRDIEL